MRVRSAFSGVACALLALSVASCGDGDRRGGEGVGRGGEPLRVLAAASLGDVVGELADRFEREAHGRVTVGVGGSASLRRQIELGAPADVFISADGRQVAMLERAGRTVPDSARRVAGNALVIVVSTDANSPISTPADLRARAVRRIAIANPEYAPAGRYARDALTHCGVWAEVGGKLVQAENVRHAALHVRSGAVDAAIVFESDLRGVEGLRCAYRFPADAHERIDYVGVVVSSTRHATLAHRFLEYLAADRNAEAWRAHGFLPAIPEGAGS